MTAEHPEEPDVGTVELEMWMWKQVLGLVRHSKHTAKTEYGRKDSERIEQAIQYQLEE